MQLSIKPGKYVVGVSGGVDSMALMHLLKNRPGVSLTIAHLDHGIRPDSHKDRQLVQRATKEHGVPFVYHQLQLGPKTSEQTARDHRYKFLHKVRVSVGAESIVTAHHQDDLLETAIINMLRGTGRRGLNSLKSTDGIIRPLLKYPKERILDYAHAHKIAWREDPSNNDLTYTRNLVRHKILNKFTLGERAQMLILLEKIAELNEQIDQEISNFMHYQPATNQLDRNWFINLPYGISKELVHSWLTKAQIKNTTRKKIDGMCVTLKTAHNNTNHVLDKNHYLKLGRDSAELITV